MLSYVAEQLLNYLKFKGFYMNGFTLLRFRHALEGVGAER